MNYGFADSIKADVDKVYAKLITQPKLRAKIVQQSLESHLERNNFRMACGQLADRLIAVLQGVADHKYPGQGIRIHKIPEVGVNEQFSFSIVGNEDYDRIMADKILERGNIYTSKDRPNLIPTPLEEAQARTLLFRTSKGEVIKGDPFIEQFAREFLQANAQFLGAAFDSDVTSYAQQLLF